MRRPDIFLDLILLPIIIISITLGAAFGQDGPNDSEVLNQLILNIYIDDAAVAVTSVITNSNFTSGIVNIGSGKSYAVMDIADMLRSGFMANNIMVDIRTPYVEQPDSLIRDNRLDITLARSIGAIGELIRMEQGLQMCIESRKEHEHIS